MGENQRLKRLIKVEREKMTAWGGLGGKEANGVFR